MLVRVIILLLQLNLLFPQTCNAEAPLFISSGSLETSLTTLLCLKIILNFLHVHFMRFQLLITWQQADMSCLCSQMFCWVYSSAEIHKPGHNAGQPVTPLL